MHKLITIISSLLIVLFSFFHATKPTLPPVNNTISTPSIQPSTPIGQVTKTIGCLISGSLPDKACTPGAIDPRVTQETVQSTICVKGYTQKVRPPVSVTEKIKQERMQAYGDTDSLKNYELDHLIPLELGGCPDCIANLWPEPYNTPLGAHEKDKVENDLHDRVCNGQLSLTQAQNEIVTDWAAVYKQIQGNK